MTVPIHNQHNAQFNPALFGYALQQGPRFGADESDDKILGGGAQNPPAPAEESGDTVEIGSDKSDQDKSAEEEFDFDAPLPEGSGKGNVKYNLGVFMEEVLPFLLGFVSIGTGPVGWMMFPALWLAGYGLGRVGRNLKNGVDEKDLSGLAARVLKMKEMFRNPQLVKNGKAMTALEGTVGAVLNPVLATVRSFPGGTWLTNKVGLAEGIKLSGEKGIGRFLTNRAFERAMIFDTAAEEGNIFKAAGKSGKLGLLLMTGNAIMKLGNSAPGPFKWIFKLLGLALPWLGMKKSDKQEEAAKAAPQQEPPTETKAA